jgi:plasmid stability protein
MKNITVSVDDETHRSARIRAAELGTSVSALVRNYLRGLSKDSFGGTALPQSGAATTSELRRTELYEVVADFEARGVGLRMSENLTRDELYNEAMNSTDAVR